MYHIIIFRMMVIVWVVGSTYTSSFNASGDTGKVDRISNPTLQMIKQYVPQALGRQRYVCVHVYRDVRV